MLFVSKLRSMFVGCNYFEHFFCIDQYSNMTSFGYAFNWTIKHFKRLYSKPCATYETASLRQFQLGRTDTIRSCSIESLEFSKGMMDASLSKQKKAELLRKAVTGHKNYVAEVSSVFSLMINFRWKYVPFKQYMYNNIVLWTVLSIPNVVEFAFKI